MEKLTTIDNVLSEGINLIHKIAFHEGIESGFRMLEALLEKDIVPETLTKDDLRAIICEFRRNNNDEREKLLKEAEDGNKNT